MSSDHSDLDDLDISVFACVHLLSKIVSLVRSLVDIVYGIDICDKVEKVIN